MNDQLIRVKTTRRILLAVGILLAMSPYWSCLGKESEQEQPAASPSKIPLRVLYVGLPGTERQKDFVTFLAKHFKQVETADYNTFEEKQTKNCDVAIFDKDGLEWKPLNIRVSSRYSRATMSLGVPGAFWVRSVSRKMGYM